MFVPVSLALFALGAIVASFIGVLVARLNTGQSILLGRSYCDACGTPLSPLSLVPIISFIALGQRALCCGARLSYLGPLTELLLGGLFVLAYREVGLSAALPCLLIALSLLLALVLYDLDHQIVPLALLGPFIVVSAFFSFLLSTSLAAFALSVLSALIVASPLLLLHLFSGGRWMGFADAPLTFGLALLVGSTALPGLIFSFWIGAVIGLLVLAARPAGSRMRVEVPFAPFLATGFLLAYFTQWNPFIFIALLPSK